jgi:hypothetical protein
MLIDIILLFASIEQILYRHSSCVKITHASINAARSLCCTWRSFDFICFQLFCSLIFSKVSLHGQVSFGQSSGEMLSYAFVEPTTFDVFVAEMGSPNPGRLFSLKFSRSSPIRAFLAPHDAILLLYRDGSYSSILALTD